MNEETYNRANEKNVADPERLVSVIAGGALAVYGLKARSIGGAVLAAVGAALVHRGATGHCMVYESMGITTAPEHQGEQVSVPYGRGIRVEQTTTINVPPEQLYNFWRNFENLPLFMCNLESVTIRDGNRSHWVAVGPAGTKADWEAEIINEVPNELIGWRSVEGSRVDNAGSVHFKEANGGRGTEVKVVLRYDPPGGAFGAAVAKLFGEDPQNQVKEDLRRLKMLLETGEVATIGGQPTGRK